MEKEYNVEKSLKSCKSLSQKKKNCNKNQGKRNDNLKNQTTKAVEMETFSNCVQKQPPISF